MEKNDWKLKRKENYPLLTIHIKQGNALSTTAISKIKIKKTGEDEDDDGKSFWVFETTRVLRELCVF